MIKGPIYLMMYEYVSSIEQFGVFQNTDTSVGAFLAWAYSNKEYETLLRSLKVQVLRDSSFQEELKYWANEFGEKEGNDFIRFFTHSINPLHVTMARYLVIYRDRKPWFLTLLEQVTDDRMQAMKQTKKIKDMLAKKCPGG